MSKGGKTLFLLEGNIAAGKSTVGKNLQESGQFGFIEEPVEEWRTGFTKNLLEMMYSDMERWAFTFQINAFITRAKTWKEILAMTDHSRVVLERSIFTDRYVFAENMFLRGAMTEIEWKLYQGLWEFLNSNYCVEPDHIIYLRTPASECLERIKRRGRGEEKVIDLNYLRQLEQRHDAWLLDNPRATVLDGRQHWTADKVVEKLKLPLLRQAVRK